MKEQYDRRFLQLEEQYQGLQQQYGNDFGALKENITQEFEVLKEHIDRHLTDWMSKTSFHGREEEEKGDHVYMTPPHPKTSASVPYEQEDHLIIVAPMQRTQQIRKQSQVLQTLYTNPEPICGRP